MGLKKIRQNEEGSVIVIFSICLVVMISFASLALDIGVVNMKRARMMELCQQIRKTRLDAKDYIMNEPNPARAIYEIANQCAIENNFTGDLKIYYRETTDPVSPGGAPCWVNRRTYTVRIELRQTHDYVFPAGLIAGRTGTISAFLDGGEQKTASKEEGKGIIPVWCPGTPKNGSWKRTDRNGISSPQFTANDFPADW